MDPTEITPDRALQLLQEGNRRFLEGIRLERDLRAEVRRSALGQRPFAIVLGCIDSRVPPELVFDQGIADIFTVRVAGNVVDTDQLGSLEFACELAGARLVVVLGHTRCGAVAGALEGAELGNLTALLSKIGAAVNVLVDEDTDPEVSPELIARVAEANVCTSLERIRTESPVLEALASTGAIRIVGAMYHVETGEVRFLD